MKTGYFSEGSIRNPEIIEEIEKVKYAVFDKTGTLTQGRLKVVQTNIDENYLGVISKIESFSEHPISKAIVEYIGEKESSLEVLAKDIDVIAGFGIKALFDNGEFLIGSKRFLEQNGVSIDSANEEFFNDSLNSAKGVVLASFENRCIGAFAFEDSIKEGAKELILSLKDEGIEPILLTGDNKTTAMFVAKELGIDRVFSEVVPTKKYDVIKELQKDAKVMFVGDGINDALSLKQADIGITLNSGADISKDAGDIILINNDLKAITKSINLSKESMKIVKQNLFWAFFYNGLGIPLASGALYFVLGVFLTPMYAGVAMSFSSVTVVLNSLRLKIKKL